MRQAPKALERLLRRALLELFSVHTGDDAFRNGAAPAEPTVE
jgi:hypothetical protein